MAYQYRNSSRAQAVEALRRTERELEQARSRASRAERRLQNQGRQVMDAELRAREAHNERKAFEEKLSRVEQERDQYRREVDRLTQPAPVAPWYGDPRDLVLQDSLIRRCRCGSWVYRKPLCSHCTRRQQIIEETSGQHAV